MTHTLRALGLVVVCIAGVGLFGAAIMGSAWAVSAITGIRFSHGLLAVGILIAVLMLFGASWDATA